MFQEATRIGRWTAAVLGLAVAAACTNPVEGVHEGRDAIGARIYDMDAAEPALLTQTTGAGAPWTAPISIGVGETRQIQVRFIDPDGEEFVLTHEGEFRLRFHIPTTETAARYEPGTDTGALVGVSAGSVEAIPYLWHGRTGGHSDWTPGPLTITVTP